MQSKIEDRIFLCIRDPFLPIYCHIRNRWYLIYGSTGMYCCANNYLLYTRVSCTGENRVFKENKWWKNSKKQNDK